MQRLRARFGVVWVGLCVLLLLGCGREGWAQSGWMEVRSPHFRVVTNGSADDGRKVAAEFEQMRYVLHYRIPSFRVDSPAPLLIVAARDEATARELEPALWARAGPKPAGVFHSGWERTVALVRLDQWKAGARSVVYHEYTHSVLHLNAHWLPRWLDEGLAEFFGYTRFEDHRILIGVTTDRWRTLGNQRLWPVATLLGMEGADYLGEDSKVQLFYAESWALVHYTTFGPGMENGRKLFAFYDRVQAGEEQIAAFRALFGDLNRFDGEFERYVKRGQMEMGVVPTGSAAEPGSFAVRELSPAEAAFERGAYMLGSKNPRDAMREIALALQQDPALAPAHEEMGYLLYELGDPEAARKEWREAVRRDAGAYRARFALAMTGVPVGRLLSVAEQEEMASELQAVIRSNGQYAPAHVEEALLLWREKRLDDALAEAKAAEALEPWRAGYHLLTGEILLAQGQGARAAGIARYVAERWTGTDRNEAVQLWSEVPANERGPGPALTLNLPSGDRVVRGRLTGVACPRPGAAGQLAVEVRPEGEARALTLLAPEGPMQMGFSDTLWFGEDHLAFCREAVGLATTVAYRPTGPGEGQLLWLDLRDDLPVPEQAGAGGEDAKVGRGG